MKSIYILLTRSTTICSRIVYMATRSEFTHAAISLDRNFDKLHNADRAADLSGKERAALPLFCERCAFSFRRSM